MLHFNLWIDGRIIPTISCFLSNSTNCTDRNTDHFSNLGFWNSGSSKRKGLNSQLNRMAYHGEWFGWFGWFGWFARWFVDEEERSEDIRTALILIR